MKTTIPAHTFLLLLLLLTASLGLLSATAQPQVPFNGKDLAGWRKPACNWTAAKAASLDPANPERFVLTPGEGVLVNGAEGKTTDLVTEAEFGDFEAHIEFCVPKHSNSGVYLMGRYEVQVYDSYGVE